MCEGEWDGKRRATIDDTNQITYNTVMREYVILHISHTVPHPLYSPFCSFKWFFPSTKTVPSISFPSRRFHFQFTVCLAVMGRQVTRYFLSNHKVICCPYISVLLPYSSLFEELEPWMTKNGLLNCINVIVPRSTKRRNRPAKRKREIGLLSRQFSDDFGLNCGRNGVSSFLFFPFLFRETSTSAKTHLIGIGTKITVENPLFLRAGTCWSLGFWLSLTTIVHIVQLICYSYSQKWNIHEKRGESWERLQILLAINRAKYQCLCY